MAKLVVQHDVDPAISMVLTEWLPANGSVARGWRGQCSECGKTVHRWYEEKAVEAAKGHVDSHESSL
jgi:hypothetical protein